MSANSLSVFNHKNEKMCDLYSSELSVEGQAHNIEYTKSMDGTKELSFDLPYGDDHFRWNFIRNEYLIRMIYNGEEEWFIINEPKKQRSTSAISCNVNCSHVSDLLKTRNIYMTFDDDNGIGTLPYLLRQVLAGTGWIIGTIPTIYERDGSTEKVRSITSDGKAGAISLIAEICNLFQCYPVYNGKDKTVSVYPMNERTQIVEMNMGYNMDALSVDYKSDDLITRLYVEGEYGDYGYVGIDDVNPTGLTYLMNFDYYKEIGLFTSEHQTAYDSYVTQISAIKKSISENTEQLIETEDELNTLIGQCDLVVYYKSTGFTKPKYIYGSPAEAKQPILSGDTVNILQNDGKYRTVTITGSISGYVTASDYGVVKYVTGSAGTLGAKEVSIESKQKTIESLNDKIAKETKAQKIAEYQSEIATLQGQIATLYSEIYPIADSIFKPTGLLAKVETCNATNDTLNAQADDVESDFIIAMGFMLRDGYWSDSNYTVGQEQYLYEDAVDMMAQMSKPKVTYNISIVRLTRDLCVALQDIKLNTIARINDDRMNIHDDMFIKKISVYIDDLSKGSVDFSNETIELTGTSLSSVLSRITELANLIDEKNNVYSRAQYIGKDGSIYAQRLEGQINVLTNKLISTASNWYTDERGNIVFESADGSGCMMLCGSGFMIASEKNSDGSWKFRSFGTGAGFTADEIVAGFLSADRIEAGSITTSKIAPQVGSELVLTGNSSMEDEIASQITVSETNILEQVSNNYYGVKSGVSIGANNVQIYSTQAGDTSKISITPKEIQMNAGTIKIDTDKFILNDKSKNLQQEIDDINDSIDEKINSSVVEFRLSDSKTSLTGSGAGYTYSTAFPSTYKTANNYVWQRTKIVKGSTTTYEPNATGYCISIGTDGKDGKDGEDGQDGKGITKVEVKYTVTNSATVPTKTWDQGSATYSAPTVTNRFSWANTKTTYSSGSPTYTGWVILGVYGETGKQGDKGDDGDDGKYITMMTDYYAISASNTTAPTSGWSTAVPAYDKTKPYYWMKTLLKWSDNSTAYTTAVLDYGTNEAIAKAYSAQAKADGIVNGDYKLMWNGENGVTIGTDGVTLGSNKKLQVASNGQIVIASNVQSGGNAIVLDKSGIALGTGGAFTIKSGNFAIDSSGNVSMTGSVTANSGTIGGWTIGSDKLTSNKTGMAKTTNDTDIAFWAGATNASDAKFKVLQNGKVILTELVTQNEDGNETTVNLQNYPFWKLWYHTIKSWTVQSDTLTIKTTGGDINFNKAVKKILNLTAGSSILGSKLWSINVNYNDLTTEPYPLDASDIYDKAREGYTEGTFTGQTIKVGGTTYAVRNRTLYDSSGNQVTVRVVSSGAPDSLCAYTNGYWYSKS